MGGKRHTAPETVAIAAEGAPLRRALVQGAGLT